MQIIRNIIIYDEIRGHKIAHVYLESVIRGYHVYMEQWKPSLRDEVQLEIEELNRHDRYAVAVKVGDDVVGHVP